MHSDGGCWIAAVVRHQNSRLFREVEIARGHYRHYIQSNFDGDHKVCHYCLEVMEGLIVPCHK